MKRQFYGSFAGFAWILLVAEVLARTVAPSLPVDPGMWPRIEIAQKLDQIRRYVNDEQKIDVVFAGSSMMAGGIDPLAFNGASAATSYNAAFAGPSMRTVELWVKGVVVPLVRPDAVVVGVQSRELNDNGPKHEVMFEKFRDSPGYDRASSSLEAKVLGNLEEISYFLRYRRAFREPGDLFEADGSEALAAAKVRQEIGEFGRRLDRPAPYRVTDKFVTALYEKTLSGFEVGGRELDALERLRRELERQDIELIVMEMPVTADYWEAHGDPERDRSNYEKALMSYVRSSGVTFIDASEAFTDNNAFRDPLHLDYEARALLGEAIGRSWKQILAGGTSKVRCSDACSVD